MTSPAFITALNPMLLGGVLLAVVPILIHLLNRRRFKIVRWAAMDLLLSADRRNRRRVRLEHLMILLLRCLAVVLAALLVARLVFDPAGIGLKLRGAGTVERIVLIDDSPSMTLKLGNASVLATVADAVAEFARALADERPGDTLTLILTSAPERPLLRRQVLSPERLPSIIGQLRGIAASAQPAAPDRALVGLKGYLLESEAPNQAVYLVSDFRKVDWNPSAAAATSLKQNLYETAARADALFLVDAGGAATMNLAVTAVVPRQPIMAAGIPALFDVRVENTGLTTTQHVRIILTPEGGSSIQQQVTPLAAGEAVDLVFSVVFNQPGPAALTVELPPDAMPADNARFFAGTVTTGLPVLAVDGEPDLDPEASELFFLTRALAPPGAARSGIDITTTTEDEFETMDLRRFATVFVCNVFRLSEERCRTLAAWVKDGGGLIIFGGDLMDPLFWQQGIHDASPGLMPATLAVVHRAQPENWFNLRPLSANHPVLQAFSGEQNPFLQRVKVFSYWETGGVAAEHVKAAYSDGAPFIIEHALGEGRVILCTTSADSEWSNWPADPSYVVTLQEMAWHAARPTRANFNLVVGERLDYALDPSVYRTQNALTAPSGAGAELAAEIGGGAGQVKISSGPLSEPGLWRLELQTHEQTTENHWFAVNPAAAESALAAVEPGFLQRTFTGDKISVTAGPGMPKGDAEGSRLELTRLAGLLLLTVLFMEQSLAWFIGRRRH